MSKKNKNQNVNYIVRILFYFYLKFFSVLLKYNLQIKLYVFKDDLTYVYFVK